MPYNIRREGNKYEVVVTSTGKVVGTHSSKAQAQAQLGALYTNVPDVKKMAFTGGDGWSIEFNTPDCQHGYSILKGGTGQSIGCYLTRAEAEEALKGLDTPKTDILQDEVRTTKTPEEYQSVKKSIWSGIFVPEGEALSGVNYGTLYQDDRYYFPSKATYENDGKPNVGYGNRS
jgi:hypothetical protein